MSTTKYVLFGALGVAAILLLTSDKARKLRVDLEDSAMDGAGKLKNKLWSLGDSAKESLAELRDMMSDEVEGLGDEARDRIEKIINKTASSANGLKKKAAKSVS